MNSSTADHLLTKLCEVIIGICSVETPLTTPIGKALNVLAMTTSQYNDENIQVIIDAGTLPYLNQLLLRKDKIEQKKSLQVLSDIICSSNEHTKDVLDCNILDNLPTLLTQEETIEMTTSCLINMTSGLPEHNHAVIISDVPAALIRAIANNEPKMTKNALRIFVNLLSGASVEDVARLVQCGLIKTFHEVLKCGRKDFIDVSTIDLKQIYLNFKFGHLIIIIKVELKQENFLRLLSSKAPQNIMFNNLRLEFAKFSSKIKEVPSFK